MSTEAQAGYVYTFVVWPDETWNHPQSLFDYFRAFRRKVEMYFKDRETFERFRSEMGHAGFTLRELTRKPHVQEEPVE